MPAYRYRLLDVFTETRFTGNPLAVFPSAAGLDTPTMQHIASELNLAETVFLLPATHPDCLHRARIFTPTREMRFAGHPTLGAAWVLINEGLIPNAPFLLELPIGPVPVRPADGLLWLQTPAITFGPVFSPAAAAAALGLAHAVLLDIQPQAVSAGNPLLYIALRTPDAVDRVRINPAAFAALTAPFPEPVCLFVFAPRPGGAYSRMFAPENGIVEDPATGSAAGPLAAFMIRHGLCPAAPGTRLVNEQGVKMGRPSLLHILIHANGIDVGGAATPVGAGTLDL